MPQHCESGGTGDESGGGRKVEGIAAWVCKLAPWKLASAYTQPFATLWWAKEEYRNMGRAQEND
jgi:actin-related protein